MTLTKMLLALYAERAMTIVLALSRVEESSEMRDADGPDRAVVLGERQRADDDKDDELGAEAAEVDQNFSQHEDLDVGSEEEDEDKGDHEDQRSNGGHLVAVSVGRPSSENETDDFASAGSIGQTGLPSRRDSVFLLFSIVRAKFLVEDRRSV
ncbi:hypothetical protein HG530_007768 [Fusarium avenaceum]|nr:hypothetical protein HG530_007768 [Fusarium avenaceum]